MENSNLSVSPSSIVNILTLRYDPSIVPALPKKTWEDFQPVHDEVDLEFIEKSLLQKVSEKLESFGIPANRTNMDKITNTNGNSLIDLCQCLDLKIVNGRCGSDKGIGKLSMAQMVQAL